MDGGPWQVMDDLMTFCTLEAMVTTGDPRPAAPSQVTVPCTFRKGRGGEAGRMLEYVGVRVLRRTRTRDICVFAT